MLLKQKTEIIEAQLEVSFREQAYY